jgi:hypothetical protein
MDNDFLVSKDPATESKLGVETLHDPEELLKSKAETKDTFNKLEKVIDESHVTKRTDDEGAGPSPELSVPVGNSLILEWLTK